MEEKNKKIALITGVNGQDGSYLCDLLLELGNYEVHGMIRRGSTHKTERIDHILDKITLHLGDLEDVNSIVKILQAVVPDEIYNFAAMSQVRQSYEIPSYTGKVTGIGFANLIEAIRLVSPNSKVYQASSSEMFGKVLEIPQKETTPFYPRSPYGCAKAYAFYLGRSYREGYGMKIYNGILFNHECLTEQTPIICRTNGLIFISPIEEIVPHRENPVHGHKYTTEAKDLEVWNGNKWSKIGLMTSTFDETKKLHAIEARGGYYEATSDHISFFEDGTEIETRQLRKGDKVALKKLPKLPEKMIITNEEAELLGMLVGDGWIRDGKARFSNNDEKVRLRFADLWEKVAGGRCELHQGKSGFENTESWYLNLYGNPGYLYFIEGHNYTEKRYKKVPARILNSNLEATKHFLIGYNTCDGLKAGNQKTIFKSFTTNSQTLAAGLWFLVDQLELRTTLHIERRVKNYYHININSDKKGNRGKHLVKELHEIKSNTEIDYNGWLFDLETEDGTFSAGIGNTWVHNSPRRGEEFFSKKVVKAAVRIKKGLQDKLVLGNLEAKRDIGYAKDYAYWIWKMVQGEPDDFVIATGETHSMQEFVMEVFDYLKMDWEKYVVIDEKLKRPAEVDYLQGDASKAKRILGFKVKTTFPELIKIMIDEELKEYG